MDGPLKAKLKKVGEKMHKVTKKKHRRPAYSLDVILKERELLKITPRFLTFKIGDKRATHV